MAATTTNTVVTATVGNANVLGAPSIVKADGTHNSTGNFPPPKTDKPRPHVCGTCGRSFARLEHLKRHERSHTKEKPFECNQCSRCFARRDLLLRHQQKLHQAGAASTRPRNGRRESTSGMATVGGRIRKNSVAGGMAGTPNVPTSMRPRANTISHIDGAALNDLLAAHNSTLRGGIPNGHIHHPNVNSMAGSGGFDYRGMPGLGHAGHAGLPKINTHLGIGLGGGLRTAPIPNFNDPFDIDKMFHSGSTVNPAQLHFSSPLGPPQSPFHLGHFHGIPGLDEDDGFDWAAGLDSSMMMNGNHEHNFDGSSPSAISTASQSGFSEIMLDGSNSAAQASSGMWQTPMLVPSMGGPSPFQLENMGPIFSDGMPPPNTISPTDLHDQITGGDFYLSGPQHMAAMSATTGVPAMPSQYYNPQMTFKPDSPSISSSSANGNSTRNTSMTTLSCDSITEATRQNLLMALNQASYNHRKYTQPAVSSPLSPGFNARSSGENFTLPSTQELQRYVNAYIHYFHPHMPFLHIPTLSFDSPAYSKNVRSSATHGVVNDALGGGGCLILAMAAIGASYDFDHTAGEQLFKAAKKMIQIYLDERRRADLSAAVNGANATDAAAHKSPLWLVQAMLLNLIYGHQSGDKQNAEIANIHCAALVSLAKAADLSNPESEKSADDNTPSDGDVNMAEEGSSPGTWKMTAQREALDEQSTWIKWKTEEERRRTLFAVFTLSSLTVIAYNHAPRILNSELHLDLPCDEDLWAAENAQQWSAMGGAAAAKQKAVSFADALTFLLTASQREQKDSRLQVPYQQQFGSKPPHEDVSESELKPSTFGCYILINALHVYIWETRQRHHARQWRATETEAMHAQIEPALKAWQAAWRSNPHHSLERPNPYGPLPADSIPLLDLAYLRLFVNLGRSKDAFWQRDFDGMAEELARGTEIIQHADDSPDPSGEGTGAPGTSTAAPGDTDAGNIQALRNGTTSSKRERHLRKAAFYAADSLCMSDKLGVTFAEFNSRELPIQSAMCTFDCAQVLAEWVATVQERVGRYLGVLGKDEIDFTQVPAIMLLEDEDCKLLEKIQDVLNNAEMKVTFDMNNMGTSAAASLLSSLSSMSHVGYGSKLLMMTAYMMEKAAVWPVTHVMSQALQAHAVHMTQRAEASLSAP
ncbi:hypothetical protein M501DRAFT_866405 [Patellaria atrata CBS 101060]|uniref:C2H2-type domain-containing protein n=1 Tax=Patellaria atrata CBS 101060 TaxID=1346257 RepID=A0A9P4S8Y6_9PEZI|nr:hypothetical protein M501DRAFT_866405 [Patellaria atrata CBS 101060]